MNRTSTTLAFSNWPDSRFIAGTIAITIFAIDTFIPFNIAIAVLYVTVVLMAANVLQRRGIILVWLSCVTLTILPDGSVKHVRALGHPTRDTAGNVEYVGVLMDITAAKRAEEALQELQASLAHVTRVTTLGELTASIAHEVNQPLAAIVTNGDAGLRWLNRKVPQLDEVRSAIERMIDSAKLAGEVIARLRALSRKSTSEKIRLDINEVVDEVLALIRREISVHQVWVRLDLASSLPSVFGDRVQLQQVILNLLVNSIQAMALVDDRPRELWIRSRVHNSEQVLVEVRDSGIGIDPEHVGRLFNAFFTTKADGMGMGLSICRSIIEAHGGRIWASHNDGPGMTLQFTLQAHRAIAPRPEGTTRDASV